MENVSTKKVTINNIKELKEIGKRTFFETFASGNTEENMKEYLENSFSSDKLKKELSDKNSEFYFAVIDDKEVGYLKINFGQSQTEIKGEKHLKLKEYMS